MQLNLKMVDPSDYKIGAMAMFAGWLATNPIGAWLALHPLTAYAAQGMITIALGCCAVVAQHFLRRFLRRNWPEDEVARLEEAAKRVDWASVARRVYAIGSRVDWVSVARKALAFMRRVIRRRKENS